MSSEKEKQREEWQRAGLTSYGERFTSYHSWRVARGMTHHRWRIDALDREYPDFFSRLDDETSLAGQEARRATLRARGAKYAKRARPPRQTKGQTKAPVKKSARKPAKKSTGRAAGRNPSRRAVPLANRANLTNGTHEIRTYEEFSKAARLFEYTQDAKALRALAKAHPVWAEKFTAGREKRGQRG